MRSNATQPAKNGFREGLRVQALLDTARRANELGHWLAIEPEDHGKAIVSSILVTGGSGFIGAALVKALVKDGHSVRVLDDNSRGALRRLQEVARDIEFMPGDIRDSAA